MKIVNTATLTAAHLFIIRDAAIARGSAMPGTPVSLSTESARWRNRCATLREMGLVVTTKICKKTGECVAVRATPAGEAFLASPEADALRAACCAE